MSLLFVNQLRQYFQTTKSFKISNINKWLNEKHVLCKSEQILMQVKLEPRFSKGAGGKACYRLCTCSFIQLCSAGRNFGFSSSRLHLECRTQPDTREQSTLWRAISLVELLSRFHGTAPAHSNCTSPEKAPSGHSGCIWFAWEGFASGTAAGGAAVRRC